MTLELRFRKSVSRLRDGLGLVALLFCFQAASVHAQTLPQSPVPLPSPFNPIVDNANVIDADTRQRLESLYLNLKERARIEYAVLTVQTTGGVEIFDFSHAVARGWGIGLKGGERTSFLLVVAIQDRRYFTQITDHLEGDLPDGLAGRIQREKLVPAFRQGDYSKGIYDTVQAYVATLGAKRGFNIEGIDQRAAYTADRQPASGIRQIRPSRRSLSTICCTVIVIVFVVILLSAASRGGGGRGGRGGRRRRGFGGGGLLEALFWGSVLGNLSGGGKGWGSSSGWRGGGGFGGGGFGGGGGGGFGGGFGGGGGFAGGGAGGSW